MWEQWNNGVGCVSVEVKSIGQNIFLICGNDHSKLRILVYSRLENQRIWPMVVNTTIVVVHVTDVNNIVDAFITVNVIPPIVSSEKGTEKGEEEGREG